LLKPDAGRAQVAGFDVVTQADQVRPRIGLTGQYAAVDEMLSGRENLTMFGRLYHLPKKQAQLRDDELLDRFDLADAAGRVVKTYSGGMRRRLDLAAGLILSPPVLFLDEPTTGLDPSGRLGMWSVIRELVAGGTTLFLTTQYLDEADQLADRIAVIDHGRVIAEGTSDELKSQVGGERLEVTIARASDMASAVRALGAFGDGRLHVDPETRTILVPVANGAQALPAIAREIDTAGVQLDDLSLRRPTLDDVFLTLTGHRSEADANPADGVSLAESEKEAA
jgi:ABC-2 type transport system ATP-binding protein